VRTLCKSLPGASRLGGNLWRQSNRHEQADDPNP
jgi:hypothetical protein